MLLFHAVFKLVFEYMVSKCRTCLCGSMSSKFFFENGENLQEFKLVLRCSCFHVNQYFFNNKRKFQLLFRLRSISFGTYSLLFVLALNLSLKAWDTQHMRIRGVSPRNFRQPKIYVLFSLQPKSFIFSRLLKNMKYSITMQTGQDCL